MTNLVMKKPIECSEKELEEFETLVKKGGEVAAEGLCDRIKNAKWLVFLFEDAAQLAGVAALKCPNAHYTQDIFTKAKSQEDPNDFSFEAGWIYVEQQFRGRHYSRLLLDAITKLAENNYLFATTRENNEPMRCTNDSCGLQQSGQPYKSENGNYKLILYTKRSIK